MPEVDFSTPWENGDITLVLESTDVEEGESTGQRLLYANNYILKMWSPVFETMLKGKRFKEGASKKVKLPGKKYEDILELLTVIHSPAVPVTRKYRFYIILHI